MFPLVDRSQICASDHYDRGPLPHWCPRPLDPDLINGSTCWRLRRTLSDCHSTEEIKRTIDYRITLSRSPSRNDRQLSRFAYQNLDGLIHARFRHALPDYHSITGAQRGLPFCRPKNPPALVIDATRQLSSKVRHTQQTTFRMLDIPITGFQAIVATTWLIHSRHSGRRWRRESGDAGLFFQTRAGSPRFTEGLPRRRPPVILTVLLYPLHVSQP